MDLHGKVALVTGASRGVGAAVAVALGELGCSVACAARSTKDAPQRTAGTLDETVATIEAAGGKAIAVPTNLAADDEVQRMVETTISEFGGVDVLVNNAAVTFIGDLNVPMHRHDLMMDINLRAPFIAMRVAVPNMIERGGGSIVNVSSAAALYPYSDNMSYGVSKIGLERLSVDVAKQVQEHQIAVNVFRIDAPVASEGFVANTPGADHSSWEPPEVAAEGIIWMIQQPSSYSGRREGIFSLREREGIMASRAAQTYDGGAPTELLNGLAPLQESAYREPYE